MKKYRLIYIPSGEFNEVTIAVEGYASSFSTCSKLSQIKCLSENACAVEEDCLNRNCIDCCWWVGNIKENENENLYEVVELEE